MKISVGNRKKLAERKLLSSRTSTKELSAWVDSLSLCYIMNREILTKYVLETYNANLDYSWEKYPNFAVFRHANNKKVVCTDYGYSEK